LRRAGRGPQHGGGAPHPGRGRGRRDAAWIRLGGAMLTMRISLDYPPAATFRVARRTRVRRGLMDGRLRVLAGVLFAAATIVVPQVAIVLDVPEAYAVPSFARQTGLPCEACHSGGFYPELNHYGRMFK